MALGSLLKRHRTSAGLTQEELAEKAEVSARTVSDVERGLRTRIYRDTATRLLEALGLDEKARTEFEKAARGRSSRITRTATSLPIPPTKLIGRERELEIVLSSLERPEVRLVTLTGTGGIGKTRMALAAAARTPASIFVQLGNISDPAMVIPQVAHAAGVSGTKEPTVEAIADRLRDEQVLIVLDTFEHVLDAARDIADLLMACPKVSLLVTSRESLRLRGEYELVIPTLESPDSTNPSDILEAPATALFIDRAMAAKPHLTIDEASARIIADICQRLNGLPLAIELAAARMKHLSMYELRDQLDNRLGVLTGGPRDLPQRQQTMREAVAWSYDMLSDVEKDLFRELSVFAGGWTLDAAAAIYPGSDVLSGLSALVDKSLVFISAGRNSRYGMLDVIREFGSELRTGVNSERLHAAYFLSLVEKAEPELGGSAQQNWIERLSDESDNIRAAIRAAIQHSNAETALSICGAVWRFWLLHGELSEGRKLLREALDVDPAAAPRARAKALWGLAWLAQHQSDYSEVEACAAELLELSPPSGDPVEIRNALTIAGIVEQSHLRFGAAVDLFERGVDLLREGGSTWLLATSLLNLGTASAYAGEERSESILTQARDMYAELGDEHYRARAILYVGYGALVRGDAKRASSLFADSLVTFWELEDLWGTAEALEGLTAATGAGGDAVRAARLFGAAKVLRETVNTRQFPSDRAVMERHLENVRSSISAEAWEIAQREGETMNSEDVVDYALAEAWSDPAET
jgi:predicted ATPase/DNA-binding XRE family transcriptional regulator